MASREKDRRMVYLEQRRRHSVSYQIKQRMLERQSSFDSLDEPLNEDSSPVRRRVAAVAARGKSKVQSALKAAVARGDLRRVRQEVANGASVTECDARGVTPIMLAAGGNGGHSAIEVIQELLQHKASLDAEDELGFRAVHHACRTGNIEVVRFLLRERPDDVSKRSKDGQTLLMLAMWQNKVDVLQELMKIPKLKAQVNEKDSAQGWSPLHVCAEEGLVDIAKLLLKKGARVNAKDKYGRPPLTIACTRGRSELAKYFCKKGAEWDTVDRSKRSPVMYAALNRFEKLACWLLLDAKANPSLRDSTGETLVDIAQALNLPEVRKVLNKLKLGLREHTDNDVSEDEM